MEYCRYGVKLYRINQSMNQNSMRHPISIVLSNYFKIYLQVIFSISDQFSFVISIFLFLLFFLYLTPLEITGFSCRILRRNEIYMHKVNLLIIDMNVNTLLYIIMSTIFHFFIPVQFFSVVCLEIGQQKRCPLSASPSVYGYTFVYFHEAFCDFASFIRCITSERVNRVDRCHAWRIFRGVPVISMFWNACIYFYTEKMFGFFKNIICSHKLNTWHALRIHEQIILLKSTVTLPLGNCLKFFEEECNNNYYFFIFKSEDKLFNNPPSLSSQICIL